MSIFRHGLGKFIDKIMITKLTEQSLLETRNEILKFLLQHHVTFEIATLIVTMLTMKLLTDEAKIHRFSSPIELIKENLRLFIYEKLKEHQTTPLITTVLQMKEMKREIADPVTVLFVGINGVGKTTTLAKIGNMLKVSGLSVIFAAGDTYRAGAIAQLKNSGDKLGIPTIFRNQISKSYKNYKRIKATTILFDAYEYAQRHNIDVILADTAGRMENDKNLMRELQGLSNKFEPDITIFVGDCSSGTVLPIQIEYFQQALELDGIVLSKYDADDTGGAIISSIFASSLPIFYISNGQSLEHLIPYDPDILIDEIF